MADFPGKSGILGGREAQHESGVQPDGFGW